MLVSEFLAANSNGLRDEDGDTSDWFEIYNPTAGTIHLEGWHLTDNEDNLAKQTFPSVEITPGGIFEVFASMKDLDWETSGLFLAVSTEGREACA